MRVWVIPWEKTRVVTLSGWIVGASKMDPCFGGPDLLPINPHREAASGLFEGEPITFREKRWLELYTMQTRASQR